MHDADADTGLSLSVRTSQVSAHQHKAARCAQLFIEISSLTMAQNSIFFSLTVPLIVLI